jgi:anti-sigma factor RsiW
MDQLSGRESRATTTHLSACASCRARADESQRLLGAGRRALSVPALSSRAKKRAVALFRREQRPRPGVLRLVLDTLLRPAPALRAPGTAARYLRFEGDVTVELQVSPQTRGVELRGQITPADAASEVIALSGKARRRARIEKDGTFVFRALPRRKMDLQVGAGFIRDLEL